ncbi:MAG: ABC transporter permease, partial [Alphaproteobacteria bacterium]
RPAIVVGLSLVLMETLNDFGTVDYFAVGTLTAGVFNVWLHMGNAGGAAQIALVMLLVVVALISTERLARRRRRFHHTTSRYRPLARMHLTGRKAALATLACGLPVLLGFLVPVLVLLDLGLGSKAGAWGASFLTLARNSLLLSGVAAVVAVAVGTVLAYGLRLRGGRVLQVASRIASAGYAVPGAVLAVGVLIPFAALDNNVDAIMRERFGISTGLVLTGTIFAIVFAYVVRFLAAAFGAVDAGLAKISPGMDMAARTLGSGSWRTLTRVHLPLLRGSLLTAATLVFVDSMKELPATLILRPFNFDTLATHVYQFASDELLQEAAPAALTIVAAGIVPVLLLIKTIGQARPGRRAGG